MADKIDRGSWGGMRARMVCAAILCFFGTMTMCAWYPELDQEQAWGALKWLIGTIGVGVAGDTARPSGQKGSAFSVTSNGAPKDSSPPSS
jgi:hypothetical protein